MKIGFVAMGDACVKEVFVAMKSLRILAKFQGPMYVVTDQPFAFARCPYPCLTVRGIPSVSAAIAAGLRLRLPELLSLEFGETFLYLDTDIVALSAIVQEVPGPGVHVYGYPQRTQKETSFAGLISNDPTILQQVAFNSGLMMFQYDKSIQDAFREARETYDTFLREGKYSPCWEQPFVCESLCRRDLVRHSFTGSVWELRQLKGRTDSHVFVHGCGRRKERLEELSDLVSFYEGSLQAFEKTC